MFYRDPFGLPLRWQDEQSGRVASAIRAYLAHALDAANPFDETQLALVIWWCQYYINARAWRGGSGRDAKIARSGGSPAHRTGYRRVDRGVHACRDRPTMSRGDPCEPGRWHAILMLVLFLLLLAACALVFLFPMRG